nr:hypothetical protein CFP56_24661 [Quercus suber]
MPGDDVANPRIEQFLALVVIQDLLDVESGASEYSCSTNLTYIWQTPCMLMAWSWACFLLGGFKDEAYSVDQHAQVAMLELSPMSQSFSAHSTRRWRESCLGLETMAEQRTLQT